MQLHAVVFSEVFQSFTVFVDAIRDRALGLIMALLSLKRGKGAAHA